MNDKLHKLLDIMLSGSDVVLSEKGKEELREYNEQKELSAEYYHTNLEPVTWSVLSVKCDNTIELCSSYHDIVGGIKLDCIEIQ